MYVYQKINPPMFCLSVSNMYGLLVLVLLVWFNSATLDSEFLNESIFLNEFDFLLASRRYYNILYKINFKHDMYTNVDIALSDSAIHVNALCSETMNLRHEYMLVVHRCRNVHVRSRCSKEMARTDFIPRNYEFTWLVGCENRSIYSGLLKHSYSYIRNNIIITMRFDDHPGRVNYTLPYIENPKEHKIPRRAPIKEINKQISLVESSNLDNPLQIVHILPPYLLHLVIILLVPLAMLIVFILQCVIPPEVMVSRNRKFDAFICYNFDSDREFTEDILLQELEVNHAPPFKICIHRENFVPGVTIKRNIEDAIKSSNSAIIVMSQAFIDSVWCREEFDDCYLENMNDASFEMFVILTRPRLELVELSQCMSSFLAKRTYLELGDRNLFKRLTDRLSLVRTDNT